MEPSIQQKTFDEQKSAGIFGIIPNGLYTIIVWITALVTLSKADQERAGVRLGGNK